MNAGLEVKERIGGDHMSELGNLLKETRRQKNLSLDDVQEITKIRKRYLQAIEEGNYHVLPGPFYVRAFIKAYTETIGLNFSEIVRCYYNDMPTLKFEPILASNVRLKYNFLSKKFGRLAPMLCVWIFFVIIMAISYFIIVKYVKPNSTDTIAEEADMTQLQPLSTGIKSKIKLNNIVKKSQLSGQSKAIKPELPATDSLIVLLDETKPSEDRYYVSAPNDKLVKVNIKAIKGRSWLEVYRISNKNKKLYYDTIEANKHVSFDITNEGMFIRTGYGKVIEINIAGQPLQSLHTDGPKNVRLQWITYEQAQVLQEKTANR